MASIASTATLRADLADVIKENMYGMGDTVGLAAMPILTVGRKSGNYAVIDFGEQPTLGTSPRAPGAGYERQRREVTSSNYACEEYGREEPIDDGEGLEIGEYFDIEADCAASLAGRLMVEQEVRLEAILYDTATNFSSYTTNGTDWSTAASGTPIEDIRNAVASIKTQINGGLGNANLVGICTDTTLINALGTTQVRNALNAGSDISFLNQDAAAAALARACGITTIRSTSIQNNGASIWDDHYFGVYLVGNGRDLASTPQVGRTFLWVEDSPANGLVEEYRDEAVRSNVIRVRHHVDEQLLNARAGHVLTGLNA